jgi:anti-anti-sigma regulatory factor
MWKVRRIEDGGRIVLRLSGRFEGEQLNGLQEVFASEAGSPTLILDLSDLRLVDEDESASWLAAKPEEPV